MESLNAGQAYKLLLERIADKESRIKQKSREFFTVSQERYLTVTLKELKIELEDFKLKHPEVLI